MTKVLYDQLQSALALGLPYIVAASLCLAAGLAALALSLLRSRDRLLLWIGIFATLYSLRLFLENDLVRIALGAPSLRAPIDAITYLIPIPYVLFFRELLGRGWKSSIQIWLWVQLAFAPVALLAGLVAGYSGATRIANNFLIVGGSALVLVPLLLGASAVVSAALRYSIAAFLVVALANNLGFRIAGQNVEPLGFLVLIAGLAYSAAQRAISWDQKLAAIQSELAIARRIQTSILPRSLPAIPGLRLAASYRPMTAVAGDFYDFLPIDQHRITILVADVSGHGVPAALIASMLKVAFALEVGNATDPAAVLRSLNIILNSVLDSQFVTAACAHIDLDAHAIVYAGAGHPPALLMRHATGELVELAENGLILGPFRNASYQNIRAPFGLGDRLLVYTDGIIEATFSDGEPFGAARLREFASAQASLEPAAFADALLDAVSIGAQEDDLTVVVAQAL